MQMTPVQMVRMVFIQVGGSDGPGGTATKWGPVIQLPQTQSWNARIRPPAQAHATTGLNVDSARASRASAGISVVALNAMIVPPSPYSHAALPSAAEAVKTELPGVLGADVRAGVRDEAAHEPAVHDRLLDQQRGPKRLGDLQVAVGDRGLEQVDQHARDGRHHRRQAPRVL